MVMNPNPEPDLNELKKQALLRLYKVQCARGTKAALESMSKCNCPLCSLDAQVVMFIAAVYMAGASALSGKPEMFDVTAEFFKSLGSKFPAPEFPT